jgi:DNA protecting protein DprA
LALAPRRALDAADRIGCRLLVPGDPGWPTVLDDLDATAPLCLWVRGPADLHALSARSVALVGARAATPYGEHVAADLAAGIAEAGGLVVSGGAYGIDVAAHRGALSAGGITVALLAGGVDRTYPAGNRDLLESLAREHGAVVAECPPGTAPVRSRFLLRNRLIAALAGATVVVEAAWRSGALSTAAHAGALLRPLGAVPGPVTSMASVGCHRPLRDGAAVCVTSTADVLELIGPPGGAVPERRAGRAPAPRGPASPLPGSDDTAQEDAAPEGGTTRAPDRGEHDLGASDLDVLASDTRGGSRYVPDPRAPDPRSPDLRTPAAEEPAPEGPDPYPAASDDPADLGPADRADLRPADRADLRPADRADLRPDGPVDFRPDDPRTRVLDALPLRGALDVTTLARRAGLAREEVEAALGSLDLSGRVRRREGRWSIVHRHP